MQDKKTKKLVLTSLFTAMICVMTMILPIPSPTQGYVNLGDCFILLGSWILGPWYGALAGGLGSALSDILGGYTYYAPGTLVIKGLCGLTAGLLFKKTGKNILSGIPAELIVILGYLGYSALILGRGDVAFLSVPGNIVQGVVGITAGTIIYKALKKAKITDRLLNN